MAFTATQIAFLQRLVRQRPALRQAGEHATFFSDHYGIGAAIGRRVEYSQDHFVKARKLLVAHDLPVDALPTGARRSVAAGYGGMSEKDFSSAPHSDSVAIKALGKCLFGGRELFAPMGGYIVLTTQQAVEVSCERLLLIENLETFRRLEAYTWIDFGGRSVLALYRGDSELPLPDVAKVVATRTDPLWAFADFDPAGLGIVAGLPTERLERLILPGPEWLEREANTARGRQLFDSQASQYWRTLDSASHPGISGAWSLMKRLQSAVTQERMENVD